MTNNNLSKEQKDAERLKYWKIQRGARKLKNRSSKDILRIHHYNKNKVWRQLSGEALKEMANNGSFDAQQEILRRDRRRAKKEAKKEAKA